MIRQWARPLITALIVGGVALIVVLNLDLRPSSSSSSPREPPTADANSPPRPPARAALPAGFREYPIGDEMVKNAMQVAAVWLPSVRMEGMEDLSDPNLIHLEADVRATEGNPNGFAKDEFVPYLKITYTISPAGGGPPVHRGELIPMVARDGLHYGANIAMPRAGSYRLTYQVAPPSAGGLGRHSDPAAGVAPWWQPFEATFDWDYPGPPQGGSTAFNP
ncbi:MAG: iron transporter [Singulisphaera sp.]